MYICSEKGLNLKKSLNSKKLLGLMVQQTGVMKFIYPLVLHPMPLPIPTDQFLNVACFGFGLLPMHTSAVSLVIRHM